MAETPGAAEIIRRNVESIRRAYAEAGNGNMAEMLEIVDPEVVLRDRPESPDPRTYHGHAGLTQALESSNESFESFALYPEEFIAEGDHVIVVLTMRGTGRGSGVPVEERIAHQWLVRDGKAVAMQVYSDPVEAIRDARESG